MQARTGRLATRVLWALLAAACGSAAQAQTAPSYVIEDLGVLTGDTESLAVALNSSGQAVGRSRPAGGFFKAAIWSAAVPVDLATVIGQQTSIASGINDAGHLTTLAGFTSATSTTGTTAHFWNGTSLTDIGAIGTGAPTGFPRSLGNDINGADQVVGRSWTSSGGSGEFRGFSWQGGVIKDLGTLSGCTESEALAVNSNGQIAGVASGGICTPTQGVVWASKDAAPTSINATLALASISDNIVRAYDVNDSGTVLAQRVASGRGRCVIFRPSPTPSVTDIGFIGTNGILENCVPGRINSQGEAVATQTGTPDGSALLYSNGALYDLNSLVAPASSGTWNLVAAYDINDAGTIVGQGRINGALHAFRATRVTTGPGGSVSIEDSIAPLDDKSVPFATATIGVGSSATVTVVNGTSAPVAVDITDTLAAPFSITNPQDCRVTLAARASCTITLTFVPATTTAASDSLTLTVNGTPNVVNVSGTGRAPAFTVSDSIAPSDDLLVPFASTVQVGGTGTATVTVRNSDSSPVLLSLTQDLPVGPFRLQNPAACNTTLTPNQTCDLVVIFQPTAAGSYSATFRVGAGGGNEKTVTVTGTPGTASADLQITQAVDRSVLLPEVAGSDTATITLTVRNNGPDGAGARVADVLPAGIVYVSHVASAGTFDSSTGLWAVGVVASGTTATLALNVRATKPPANCAENVATVSVTAPAVDSQPGNDVARLLLAAPACADLEFGATEIADSRNSSAVGLGNIAVTHRVTVLNRGPGPATSVVLAYPIYASTPAGVGFPTGSVDVGTLAPGESRVVQVVQYSVDKNGPDLKVNYELQLSSPTPDPVSANNKREGGYDIVRLGSGGSGSGCFIATAAYGSYLEPRVMVLRHFRDRVLLQSAWGRTFVGWYYRTSPPVADWIRERPWARAMVRTLLAPLVYGLQYPLSGVVLLLTLMWVPLVRRRRPLPGG